MTFEVRCTDDSVHRIDGADSYQQEGAMTTFFAANGRHRTLNAWSERVASIRTDRVLWIRKVEAWGPDGPVDIEGLLTTT
ncbi:MAG: hypothetical protein ACOYNI_07655 [Acidimicrobiia bacterium]